MRHFHKFLLAAALAATSPVSAAEQPDAGRTLQNLRQAPALPKAANPLSLETPSGARIAAGGARVTVKGLEIGGNTIFDAATLAAASGYVQGRAYDFAGLEGLADAMTSYYHAHGYPFARAYLPAQSSGGGTLKIEVVEGRYGKVAIEDGDARAAAAEGFLQPLKGGDVIEGRELERVSLILDDQPGYSFVPVIRPGQENGTGDLAFGMKRDQRFGGSVSADNTGNRYTGRRRGLVSVYANSPFLFGDQLTASGIYTEENMWFGSAGYNLPIGTSGLRGSAGYSRTSYELGKTFTSLDAHGTADVVSAGVSYPVIRSQEANVGVGATYNHKWLTDEQGAAGTTDKKTSNTLPVTVTFDRRDTLFGGGVTYGMASWTHGIMDLDSGLKAADMTTAHTDGAFDKFNLDAARVQATPQKTCGSDRRAITCRSERRACAAAPDIRARLTNLEKHSRHWMPTVLPTWSARGSVTPSSGRRKPMSAWGPRITTNG